MTGARIEGLNTDERIFGVYGPGDPQKVLAELLDSSNYNVLIAGRRPDGAPREIVLSTPSALPAQTAVDAASFRMRTATTQPDNSGYADTATPAPMPSPQGRPGTEQPRTAQQMLQELQRMRQQAIPGNGYPWNNRYGQRCVWWIATVRLSSDTFPGCAQSKVR